MIQVELHRHLDVSARPSTVLELAQKKGLEAQSTSLDAFREKIILKRPFENLEQVLAQFVLFQKVLDSPEVMERVACEVIEDCHAEGTRQVELRFSPSFVCEFSGLEWKEALEAFHRGMKRGLAKFPGMKAGLICIASRDYGADAALKTVEFFLENRDRFVGVDLAGNEVDFPCRVFESAFRKAKEENAAITIHAGEASGPENIWEAIELLGARRIGHGIHCVEDPKLMDYLREKSICLEMCPTSNWLTRATPDLARHPLPQVLRAGIPVCINTDDPGMFGVTVPGEAELCRKVMGLSQEEVEKCFDHAHKASFLVS